MNSTSKHFGSNSLARFGRSLLQAAALTGLLAVAGALQAQTYYDFDNGTDTGWLVSSNHPSTITYPADSFGGHAFRLQGTPMTSGSDTNSRVFCYFTNRMYTNFYAAVDLVAWDTNQDDEEAFGLFARANNYPLFSADPFYPDEPFGVSFNVRLHDYRVYTGPTNSGPLGSADQSSIWSFWEVGGVGQYGNPVAVTGSRFRLVPGHKYRMVLSNTNSYNAPRQWYTCSFYDVNDLTKPLLTMTGDDSFAGGAYIPPAGYVGVFVYKVKGTALDPTPDYDPNVDVTFDNFYVGEGPPATAVVAPAIPHGKIGAPQVINRVPVSFKNFHPAASGITFNATTLTTTNNINSSAIKLYLNGVDVSAGLAISGYPTNYSVSYNGLVTNVVYDARIELQDALGRRTTNEWTFDTFSDAYLGSSAVKVIEAEDYDFGSGGYINDPPASGYANYDPVAETGTIINSGSGYVDKVGTAGVDFYDTDSTAQATEDQYRHSDPVGTQQDAFGLWVGANATGGNTGAGYDGSQTYDTQRSKYSSLNSGLQEYSIERVRGGEWENYTRVFDGSKYYNAYLRAAAGLAMSVRLDQITAGPVTNLLGQFNVPSTFWNANYRYTPLVRSGGDLSIINFSGIATNRMTVVGVGPNPDNDVVRDGLYRNYIVLVPAAPQVYSSATVNGPYTPELSVLVDTGNKKITVPRSSTTRFYRIGWTSAVSITGLSFSGPNVVLTYQ